MSTSEPDNDKPALPSAPARKKREMPAVDLRRVRTLVAQLAWVVCVLFSLVLAVTVLLVAIKANTTNDLVRFIGHFSDHVDLGFFDLGNPIKTFGDGRSHSSMVQTTLFNYGLAAIVWLVIGRVLDRLIRPGSVTKK